jgi:hypothetical protein
MGFVVYKVALGKVFFFSEYCSFSLSLSFHKCSVFIFTYMLVFQEDEWAKPVNVPRKTILSRISGSIGLEITFASSFFKG